jgi:hypothetical protein
MGIFKDMWNDLQRVESEGFDPMNETYGERMKAFVQQMKGGVNSPSVPAMTATQQDKLRQMLRSQYPDVVQEVNSYYISGEGGKYTLKPDMTELNMRKRDKNSIEDEVWESVNVTDLGGSKEYTIDLPPNSSGLSEKYYKRGADVYDTLMNSMTLNRGGGVLDKKSSYTQKLAKAGRSKLRTFIEKELPGEELKKIGITRQQALNIVPTESAPIK